MKKLILGLTLLSSSFTLAQTYTIITEEGNELTLSKADIIKIHETVTEDDEFNEIVENGNGTVSILNPAIRFNGEMFRLGSFSRNLSANFVEKKGQFACNYFELGQFQSAGSESFEKEKKIDLWWYGKSYYKQERTAFISSNNEVRVKDESDLYYTSYVTCKK